MHKRVAVFSESDQHAYVLRERREDEVLEVGDPARVEGLATTRATATTVVDSQTQTIESASQAGDTEQPATPEQLVSMALRQFARGGSSP